MKRPVILPGTGSGNLQLSAILSKKISFHSDLSLIMHGLDKVRSVTMHGNNFCYKVDDQVMEV
ncbi:MAG TPA: hypothetical protein VGG71_08100 [Chitinophagaceae bacterium]|jgi:hypothetical protein